MSKAACILQAAFFGQTSQNGLKGLENQPRGEEPGYLFLTRWVPCMGTRDGV